MRIVVKTGSAILSRKDGGLDPEVVGRVVGIYWPVGRVGASSASSRDRSLLRQYL